MNSQGRVIKDIEKDGFSVSAYLNGERIFASLKAGLLPLAEFVVKQSKEPKNYKGLIIGDKVIGKAGAFLILNLEPSFIYGSTISIKAKDLITNRGINLKYCKLVPKILNKDKTDSCPMEKLVADVGSPEEALNIFKKLFSLS
jgi:hypothetical protein